MARTLTHKQLETAVHNAYDACKDLAGGQNAHYIPYLANVDAGLFGLETEQQWREYLRKLAEPIHQTPIEP